MVIRGGGGSGLSSIGVGTIVHYKDLVKKLNKGDAKFKYDLDKDPVEITITGKAVFEESREVLKIKFKCNPGSLCTILSNLSTSEIYFKIKKFYGDILDNCLGKTTSEQQNYVFRNNPRNKPGSSFIHGRIEYSENYIRNLPENPTNMELKELAEQILDVGLVYANIAQDGDGVEMGLYAKALLKRV